MSGGAPTIVATICSLLLDALRGANFHIIACPLRKLKHTIADLLKTCIGSHLLQGHLVGLHDRS